MASVGDLWQGLTRTQIAAARARGDMRYEARWRVHGRSAKRRFSTRDEALAFAVEQETQTPPPAEPGAQTVGDALTLYIESKRRLSPRGRENAELHAAHVRHGLGTIPLDRLTRSEVEAWLDSDPAVAPSSWAKRLTCLRAALRLAGAPDPSTGLVVGVTREPMDFLTLRELAEVARVARSVAPSKHGPKGERPGADLWENLILFLGTSGPRVSEALAIRVADFQRTRQRVYVAGTKTSSARRWVPLSTGMTKRLTALAGDRDPDLPLFATSRGTRINRERVGERVREASLRALGRRIRVHDLRHTAATHLIEAGGLVVASRILGHANPGITASLYGHATQSALDSAVAAVGRGADQAAASTLLSSILDASVDDFSG